MVCDRRGHRQDEIFSKVEPVRVAVPTTRPVENQESNEDVPAHQSDKLELDSRRNRDPASGARNGSTAAPREQATRAAKARQVSGRRRFVDPTTCEREYSEAEMEFMLAMNEYKQKSGRMFPTWSEVLEVLRGLGYEKPAAGLRRPSERRGGLEVVGPAPAVPLGPDLRGPSAQLTAVKRPPMVNPSHSSPSGSSRPTPIPRLGRPKRFGHGSCFSRRT